MNSNVQSVYNQWAESYDLMENKTRDLDKMVTRFVLEKKITSSNVVLELGCGTGKNTEWLMRNARQLTSIDFSEEMLKKARQKLKADNLVFLHADIKMPWLFNNHQFNIITCNLILEHIEDLNFVFSEAARVLKANGHLFVSELHPFKQYNGGKARFEINNVFTSPDCFIHHISDFFAAASNNGFVCVELKEWFDNDDKSSIPRLISFLFKKIIA